VSPVQPPVVPKANPPLHADPRARKSHRREQVRFCATGFPYRRVRIQGRGRVRIQVHCISGPCC
jgi:hypothetical protein